MLDTEVAADAPPASNNSPLLRVTTKSLDNSVFLKWFAIVNGGLVLTTVLWLGPLSLAFPIVGTGGAFLALLLSRWLATRAHHIEIINPANFKSAKEEALHRVVAELATRAGLPATPTVGIYESPDLNAFATGPSQAQALVAFSTALLEALPPAELRAVAAHEIGHIACRDMLVMVLLQGVINTIVLAVTAPLAVINWVANRGDSYSWLADAFVRVVQVTATLLLTFLGSLGVKAFSRGREYRADAFAARLVGAAPMAAALRRIGADNSAIPSGQMAFAALKVSGRASFHEWFSTHPELEKRVAALEAPEVTAEAVT
jgi:heat shock protein HtpX